MATLLEGANIKICKVFPKYSFYFFISVLLCCVVNKNVFKSCVNNQSIVLKCHLGIPNARNTHISDNVLAIEYLKSLRKRAKWKYGVPTKLVTLQFQLKWVRSFLYYFAAHGGIRTRVLAKGTKYEAASVHRDSRVSIHLKTSIQ